MKKIFYLFILPLVALIVTDCSDPYIPESGNIIVTTRDTEKKGGGIVLKGNYTSHTASPKLKHCGFVYSTSLGDLDIENPNFKKTHIVYLEPYESSYNHDFSETINDVTALETYYVKAFVVDNFGNVVYGEAKTFSLDRVVTVTTGAASNVGFSSVTLNGSVNCQGGASITRRGFWLGKNASNPSDKSDYEKTTQNGDFSLEFRYLDDATKYYYHAYVVTDIGETIYGEIRSFTTRDENSPIPISEFLSMNTGYYMISGVVWDIVSTSDGYFYLVDETGIVPVYGLESFSSLGISKGSNITIRATPTTVSGRKVARYATFIRENTITTDLPYTFSIEPTTTTIYNYSYTNVKIYKDDDWYGLVLYDGTRELCLWFICNYNSTTVIPVGTYNVATSYSKGTIAASPGFDLNNAVLYNSFYYDYYGNSDFPKQKVYCITGGYVQVSASGSTVTLTIRVTTHNGSSINSSWTGTLKDYYSSSAPERMRDEGLPIMKASRSRE